MVDARARRTIRGFDHVDFLVDLHTGPAHAARLEEEVGVLEAALDLTAERRKRMAEVAIRHIAENFTLDKMCASTLAVYEEILAAKAPGKR